MADADAALRAGSTEPPYWAVITVAGKVLLYHGKPTAREIHDAVGGWLEAVPIGPGVEPLTAYCNEEGKLQDLRPNFVATRFLRVAGDLLAGDVVIIGPPDAEGDDTPLLPETRMRLAREVIEGIRGLTSPPR